MKNKELGKNKKRPIVKTHVRCVENLHGKDTHNQSPNKNIINHSSYTYPRQR